MIGPGRLDLLAKVATDLGDCRIRRAADVLEVEAPGGTAFVVRARVEGHRLLRMTNTVIVLPGPPTTATQRVVLRHTGAVRRRGLAVARATGDGARATGDHLLADDALASACLALDVTRFEVVADGQRWTASLELMGGAVVTTRLPPTTRYVPIAPDQTRALLATLDALDRALAGLATDAHTPHPGAGAGARGHA